MSISNGVVLPFMLILVSTSVVSPKSMVFGSSVPEQRYNRIDPLNHLKHYRGGYDIRNKHYWASTLFTGIHGYATGGAWLLCGLVFGIFMVVRSLCCSSSTVVNHSDSYYLSTFLLVLLFTSLAIVAASIALSATQKFFPRMRKMVDAIVEIGADAQEAIGKVSETMEQMHNALHPYDQSASDRLNLTAYQLGRESKIIEDFVSKDGEKVQLAIKASYFVHLGVLALHLLLLVTALVLLLVHWHPGLIMIIFFCWILTSLCWFLTGIDYFLCNFGDDTCAALQEFKLSPQNNSLDTILPCGGSSKSNKALVQISYTAHNFITKLNSKVEELHVLLHVFGLEDLLGFSEICNPFSGPPNYSYKPDKCPKNALPISQLPDVLEKFTCYKENSTGTCKGVGKFVPEDTYNKAWAYSDSIQDLMTIFPDLQSLTSCSFVRDSFSKIVDHQCSPFKVSVRMLWASMLSLSIAMMFLVLTWIVKAFQERGRNFSICSIIPHPT